MNQLASGKEGEPISSVRVRLTDHRLSSAAMDNPLPSAFFTSPPRSPPTPIPLLGDPDVEPIIRNDFLPVVYTQFSILDYLYTWQIYVPMLALMAAAPVHEFVITVVMLWNWSQAQTTWPTEFPPVDWTAWVLRLPHIGVSILFANRLIVGYIRAKEKRIRDELEGVQKSRHV